MCLVHINEIGSENHDRIVGYGIDSMLIVLDFCHFAVLFTVKRQNMTFLIYPVTLSC